MLTLADVQTARFQSASGYGTSSSDFLELLNDAVDELIRRGDFSGTLIPIQVCLSKGCATFPRYVGEVRKMYSCRHTIEVRNVWYRFLEGMGRHDRWRDWHGEERNLEMQYRAPTFADVQGTGNYLQFYPTVQQDVGATITIFGQDDSGQDLKTQNGDGTWSPGITLVATMPFTQSATTVNHIDRVVCTETNSYKLLYAYNPGANSTYQLASYEPTETNPSYLRYKLTGCNPNPNTSCCGGGVTQSIVALVKLQNLPIQNPMDLVIINSREALLLAIKAMKLEDASVSGDANWKAAIERLNRQLENDSPDDQFSAANNTWGDDRCFVNQAW